MGFRAHRKRKVKHDLDFPQFVGKVLKSKNNKIAAFSPQSLHLTGPKDTIRVDFLGYFEHYDAHSKAFTDFLGMTVNQEIPVINTNTYERSIADDYDAMTQRRVREFYAEDFENFGYNPDSLTDLMPDFAKSKFKPGLQPRS